MAESEADGELSDRVNFHSIIAKLEIKPGHCHGGICNRLNLEQIPIRALRYELVYHIVGFFRRQSVGDDFLLKPDRLLNLPHLHLLRAGQARVNRSEDNIVLRTAGVNKDL
jgi:hypothetical protein